MPILLALTDDDDDDDDDDADVDADYTFQSEFRIVVCCLFHKISSVWRNVNTQLNKYILTNHGNKIEICLNRNSAQLSVTQELSP